MRPWFQRSMWKKRMRRSHQPSVCCEEEGEEESGTYEDSHRTSMTRGCGSTRERDLWLLTDTWQPRLCPSPPLQHSLLGPPLGVLDGGVRRSPSVLGLGGAGVYPPRVPCLRLNPLLFGTSSLHPIINWMLALRGGRKTYIFSWD